MAEPRFPGPARPRRVRGGVVLLLAIALATGVWAGLRQTSSNATPPAPASQGTARMGARPSTTIAKPRHPRTVARRTTVRPLHLPATPRPRLLSVPILMYHRIDRITAGAPAITRALTVSPSDFAGQLAWMRAHGFHTITQRQLWNALMHGAALPSRPVMLTFDDAYRDVVTYAAPQVRRYHDHATAYVITDRLSHGRVTPWMRWDQLKLLEQDGFEIGSHTVSHADLVAVGTGAARLQLRASRFALQRYLHEPVQWLAYPYGKVDPTVERLALEAGYVLAVSTRGGIEQSAQAPLTLHREEVTGDMGVAGLAALLGAR